MCARSCAMQPFTLTTSNVDAWRGLLLSGKSAPSLRDVKGTTLAGALELLATSVALGDSCELFEHLAEAAGRGDQPWSAMMSQWNRQASDRETDIHGTRQYEFFRLRSIDDKTSLSFSLFLERFCRSMRAKEFPAAFANALSKVFDELSDNVLQHSGWHGDGFTGIAGYHVEAAHAAFAVVDVGRGILARLNDSPEWSHLVTAREALRAIVARGASSRVGQGPGEGFRQLFASLVDRNAIVRLRTDDSVLTVGDGENAREGGEMRSPLLRGAQVSVNCAVRTRATEIAITT